MYKNYDSGGGYRGDRDFDEDLEVEAEDAARPGPSPGKIPLTALAKLAEIRGRRGWPSPGKVTLTSLIGGTSADRSGFQPEDSAGTETGLPQPLRGRFEASLGTDLSHIRLHHDGGASERVARLGARAYTHGADIHFGAGEYDPSSAEGQHLIAHEVAHAVQQGKGSAPAAPQFKLAASQEHDPAEREADRAADAMVHGSRASVSAQPAGVALKKPDAERKTAGVPEVLAHTSAKVTHAGATPATTASIVGATVQARAPGISMVGKVTLDPELDPEPEEIEAGWVQTVVSSRRVAVYQKAGVTVHKDVIGFESVRDAKKGVPEPWYEAPETLTKDKRAVFPMAEDQPKLKFPAEHEGAEVTALEGSDDFVVSLQVGRKGNLHNIESFSWSAPWSLRLDGDGHGTGSPLTIAAAHSHTDPRNPGTANQAGQSDENRITTYETVEAAAAALAAGFQRFVRDLPRHRRLDRGSYWNMVSALWRSNAQIRVQLVPVMGGEVDIPLAIGAENRVDKGTVSSEGTYSALGHMVYDPAALGPGHTIFVSVDNQPLELPFPYESKTFRDVKVVEGGLWDTEATINVIVSVG